MSEFINNQSQKRQKKLREIIKGLHEGKSFEEAKKEFEEHFKGISTKEIADLEQSLVSEEGVTVQEIQKLCDVHAAVFGGLVSDIHGVTDYNQIKGHPVQIFSEENRRIEQLIEEEIKPYLAKNDKYAYLMLRVALDRLWEIDKHYSRKENLFFPYLEKKGITTPPQVMWGVDDEIREELKAVIKKINLPNQDFKEIKAEIDSVVKKIEDMIFKEDTILLPLLIENLTYFNWVLIDSDQDEIGYFIDKPKHRWNKESIKEEETAVKDGEVPFDAGVLSFIEANAILNTIPFDMTFIDKDGHVKYFTQGKERLFDRPKTILGRHVNMCHPPQSVHVVEKIVNSFKTGEKDFEDFWIQMKDKFVLIRYFAIRDKENNYLGTLEISQDVKQIRELEGEKRILD